VIIKLKQTANTDPTQMPLFISRYTTAFSILRLQCKNVSRLHINISCTKNDCNI